MTEGPEGHLYCQKYTKYTEYTTQIKQRKKTVLQRFHLTWKFINWSRNLAISSSNFHRGPKSAKFGVVFNITQVWAAQVWKCSKVSELWNKLTTRRWSRCVFATFGEVEPSHHWEMFNRSASFPIIWRRKRAKWWITYIAVRWQLAVKCGMMMRYKTDEVAELLNLIYGQSRIVHHIWYEFGFQLRQHLF